MLAEVLACLAPRDGALYVDGTFGGGGYSKAILEAADCRVFAIDRDPEAVAAARQLVGAHPGRLEVVQGRFGDLEIMLETQRDTLPVDGVALDLGVSSRQIETPERGFSFQHDGPLDMRMEGPAGATRRSAEDLVNGLPEEELARLLHAYGGERKARRVARAIARARRDGPITRTGELAAIVRRALALGRPGQGVKVIDPATRTFQALRIAVNDELGELGRGLEAAERVLAPGARLVVVAFHSLEDRLVKDFLRQRSGGAPRASRHLPPQASGAGEPRRTKAPAWAARPAPGARGEPWRPLA
jgi:16S rRNA (cytosine1402-N4)-methyltransferase